MAEDLYLLPSKLLACKPVDETDARYLNLSNCPIIKPLEKILDISMYDNKCYLSTHSTTSSKFDYSNKTLAFPEHSRISDYPWMKVLHSDIGTTPITPVQTVS